MAQEDREVDEATSNGGARGEELETFIAGIIRPQRGTIEQLIGYELALAINAHFPTEKIRHILEGYFLLNDKDRGKIATAAEAAEFFRMYQLSLSFSELPEIPRSPGETGIRYAIIPWCFAPKSAYMYFEFVYSAGVVYNVNFDDVATRNKVLDGISKNPRDEDCWRLYCEKLWTITKDYDSCPLGTTLGLRSSFVAYYMPRALDLLKRIHANFINPETFAGMLGIKEGKKQ